MYFKCFKCFKCFKFKKRVVGGCQFKLDSLRSTDLLTVNLSFNSFNFIALIDTGSSVSLITERICNELEKNYCPIELNLLNGNCLKCDYFVYLKNVFDDCGNKLAQIKAYVVDKLSNNIDVVLGLDSIRENNFLRIGPSKKQEGTDTRPLLNCAITKPTKIEDLDFNIKFVENKWFLKWKWKENVKFNRCLKPRQIVPESHRSRFDAEIENWINEGILVPYKREEHGEIQNFLPLISVEQQKGEMTKIRPVLDYRELNKSVQSHPGGSVPICSERLRKWRQIGKKTAVLDLKKAYLQIHVDKSQWLYQAIKWHGKTFLLTRLGFGLCSAPKAMTKIVEFVINQQDEVKNNVTSYIDDLYIDEKYISALQVNKHFCDWGLKTKDPEYVGKETPVRVLGLKIDKNYIWTRDGDFPKLNCKSLTRKEAHSFIGELIGHFPVCSRLRIMSSMIQRMTAAESNDWNDIVSDEVMDKLKLIVEYVKKHGDPCTGKWVVKREEPLVIWTDASNLATGVALEVDNEVIEDAAWLRPVNDACHINRSELDAAIKGLNLASKWENKNQILRTDSRTVHGWLKATIEGTHNIKTHAMGEIVIKRRLQEIKEAISVLNISLKVELVKSENNKADILTRLPKEWRKDQPNNDLHVDIVKIHNSCHFGVDRTLELCQEKFGDKVKRPLVKSVVDNCEQCSKIDPAIKFRWEKGKIGGHDVWERLSSDITHINGIAYLTLIDTYSGFTIWRKLKKESCGEIQQHLNQIFSDFGPPLCLLSDNGTVYRAHGMVELMRQWNVKHEFSSAYRPQGNGIIERVHRSIKRTVGRTGRSVEEATFWFNNTTGVRKAVPYEVMFGYSSRKPGVSSERKFIERKVINFETNEDTYKSCERNPFIVGDKVFLKPQTKKCDEEWSGPHVVTKIFSSVSCEVNDDGVRRHVSFLRLVPTQREIVIETKKLNHLMIFI